MKEGSETDRTTSGGSLDLYMNFGIISGVLSNIKLTFRFIDLDLAPVNDPNGFFETVDFFGKNFSTGTMSSTGQSVANFYTISGNNDT